MYLVVNNKKIELTEGAISIKKTNNAFTFGKYTLSRTQSFKVPKTAENRKVFGLGRVDLFGSEERRKFDAQLVIGAVSHDGELYVTEVTDKDYKCTFVFGELLPLKQFSEIKTLAEALGEENEQTIRISSGKYASRNDLAFVDNVLYINENTLYATEQQISPTRNVGNIIMPSIRVRDIFELLNEKTQLQIDTTRISNNVRIILSKFGDSEKTDITLAKTSLNVVSPENNMKSIITMFSPYHVTCQTGGRGQREEVSSKFYVMENISLIFPEDFPDDLFLVADYTHYESWTGWVEVDLQFFGDYSFDWSVQKVTSLSEERERATYGIPLAGRTIEVDARYRDYYNENNTQSIRVFPRLSFFRKSNFHNTTQALSDENHYRGFFGGDATPFNFTFKRVTKSVRNVNGNPLEAFLLSNLPDISPLDLFTALAVADGSYVVIENGKLTTRSYTDSYFASMYTNVDLKNVTQIGTMHRQGITSGQNNIIEYKSDRVAENERLIFAFPVDNENLEEEKKIYTIPFNEGTSIDGNLYIDDIQEEKGDFGVRWEKFSVKSKEPTLASAGSGDFMRRTGGGTLLATRELLRKIYNASTKIVVSTKMNYFEFSQIKETTLFIFRGKKFAWQDVSYNSGNVKLTLYKLD